MREGENVREGGPGYPGIGKLRRSERCIETKKTIKPPPSSCASCRADSVPVTVAGCGDIEVELQPWKLTVRAVAPAAAAWRRLEPGKEISHFVVKSRWIFSLGS